MTSLAFSYLALVAALIADALSTIYALESRKAKEGNGFLAKLIEKVGIRPAIIGSHIGALALLYFGGASELAVQIVAGVLALIAANNVRILRKVK